MAGYTEMVEKKNPALVGTGLALWGWILRLVVGISFIFLPLVITSVSPIVDNQPVATQTIPGTTYSAQTFQAAHPESVAFAQKHATLLTLVRRTRPSSSVPWPIPPSPTSWRWRRPSGPERPAAEGPRGPVDKLVVPYPKELAYLAAHKAALTDLQNGLAKSPEQWQHWFWVCVGGMVIFIPTIWLNRGRWSPKRAREDEDEARGGRGPRAEGAGRSLRLRRCHRPGPTGPGRRSTLGP